MDSLRGNRDIAIDLVEHTNVERGQLGGSSETRKERSMRVASANVEAGKAGRSGEAVGSITAHLDSLGKSDASRSADLGHVNDIKDTSGVKVALDVVNAQVSTLVRLERKLDFFREVQRRLKNATAISSDLTLVHIELGIGELGSNLGRESTSLTLFSLDSHIDGTGRLLALERHLAGVVIIQKGCKVEEERRELGKGTCGS